MPLPEHTDPAQRPASLADGAYARLREAIVRGELRPNERLVEAALAEWLDVSRTPLRESLARLEREGLVTSIRRGWVVREHSAEEVREIHEVRAALEGMAVYLAASRGTDEEIERVVEFHNSRDLRALEEPPREHLVVYNDAFHDAVIEAARSARLATFVRLNREFFFTYRIARLFTVEEAHQSLEGHGKVVEALAARDGERGERAMRHHILAAGEVIVSKLY